MAITLYDAVPSSNSDRTKIALHEKGLVYDRVTLELAKKDQKRPEFLKLNPYGKVPVINDAGKILFESCIINEYLDEKYPNPPLMPKDPYLRGRGRVLVDYGLNYMHEPYWALRGEMLKQESERSAAVVEEKNHALRHLLQYLEEALDDKPYFLGEMSLTDIDLLPRFLRMELWRDSNPPFTAAHCVAPENEGAAFGKVHPISFAVISKFPLALPQLWDRS
jgi:glutathione S-transferase